MSDLLARKSAGFVLWHPGNAAPPPKLVICELVSAAPLALSNLRSLPLEADPEFADIRPASCVVSKASSAARIRMETSRNSTTHRQRTCPPIDAEGFDGPRPMRVTMKGESSPLRALELHATSACIPRLRPPEATSPTRPAQGVNGTYLLSTGENVIRICCGSTVNCGGLVKTPLSSMLA
jgi:hypothetical protein